MLISILSALFFRLRSRQLVAHEKVGRNVVGPELRGPRMPSEVICCMGGVANGSLNCTRTLQLPSVATSITIPPVRSSSVRLSHELHKSAAPSSPA